MTTSSTPHHSEPHRNRGRSSVARHFRLLRLALGSLVALVFILGLSAGAAAQGTLELAALVAGAQLLPSLTRAVATGLSGLGLAWLLVLALTFLFGRFYCSTLCPLGLFQDAAAWLGRAGRSLFSRMKPGTRRSLDSSRRPGFTKFKSGNLKSQPDSNSTQDPAGRNKGLHYGGPATEASDRVGTSKGFPPAGRMLLAILGVLGTVFAPSVLAWLEPYALAARLGSALFGTSWELTGELAISSGLYLPVQPLRFDPVWMAAAIVPGLLVVGAAVLRPRLFCRWLCPAGALLRMVADHSVMGFRIERDVCTSCGACQRVCRTGAADSVGRRIDSGACVGCFDCQVVCPVEAVRYGPVAAKTAAAGFWMNASGEPRTRVTRTKAIAEAARMGEATLMAGATAGLSRRHFMLAGGTGLVAASLALPAAGLVRRSPMANLVTLNGKARPWASPPGSGSVYRFSRLCLSCGLCARACPSAVLRQSFAGWKAPAVLEPYMDYARGFCQFECVACGAVCPSGAIQLLPVAAKTTVAVARSKLDLPKCIVIEKGTPCGACAEHCPTGALSMERVPTASHPIPVLDETLCVGCGACETVCPSEPVKALIVSGLTVHETARVLPERPGGAAQAAGRPGLRLDGENVEAGPGGTELVPSSDLDTGLDAGLEGGMDGFPF